MIVMTALFVLSGCSLLESMKPEEPKRIRVPQAWRETDKHLNCQQLMLEMNDAKYWYGIAANAGDMDAVSQTEARLANLQNIYQIKGCNNPYPGMNMPVM